MKTFTVCLLTMTAIGLRGYGSYFDVTVADYKPRPGETGDAPRLQRAVDACAGKVLFVPAGDYRLDRTLQITNFCSILMHKNARLMAAGDMDFVVRVNMSPVFKARDLMDFGVFIKGGRIDGCGKASCMSIHGYIHLTLRDMQFHNGKRFGLLVKGEGAQGGAELNAFNLHFVNKISGNAGNTAVRVHGADDHFTDCWSMDYTVGFDVFGGSNFFTRCHVWGGIVPAVKSGDMREYLSKSVGFRIRKSASNIVLRDCYADTSSIGYLSEGGAVRIVGCCYFYNPRCIAGVDPRKKDKMCIFKQPSGSMLVSGCMICKNIPGVKVYEGDGSAKFSNCFYVGDKYEAGDPKPGAIEHTQPSEVKLAD